MPFALYWDESDENDKDALKLRRSIYNSYEEALAQAKHDLECFRCRFGKDGKQDLRLKPTGKDPLNPSQSCQDCNGTKICPSRNILYIEDISDYAIKEFETEAKRLAKMGAAHTPEFIHGTKVWERE